MTRLWAIVRDHTLAGRLKKDRRALGNFELVFRDRVFKSREAAWSCAVDYAFGIAKATGARGEGRRPAIARARRLGYRVVPARIGFYDPHSYERNYRRKLEGCGECRREVPGPLRKNGTLRMHRRFPPGGGVRVRCPGTGRKPIILDRSEVRR
jgi:hypothetical protein